MRVHFSFLAQNSINRALENTNILLLSKEATDKDHSLKTQLLFTSNDSQEKLSGEHVWKNNGFFQDLRPDLNLEKKNIPKNTLFYINQSFCRLSKAVILLCTIIISYSDR